MLKRSCFEVVFYYYNIYMTVFFVPFHLSPECYILTYYTCSNSLLLFNKYTTRAKNYQTNWYNSQKAHYDPMNGKITRVTATMNGIVDFTKYTNKYVVIQLKDGDGSKKNYYLGYNRRKSFNEGTQENANSITILEKMGTYSSTAASTKVATLTLSQQNSYTIPNWGGASSGVSVVVTLESITNNSDDATITIVTKKTGTGTPIAPTRSPTTIRSPTPQPTAAKVTTPNNTCTGDSTTYRWRGNKNWNCEWVGSQQKKKKRRCSKIQDEQSVTDYWCCKTCAEYS